MLGLSGLLLEREIYGEVQITYHKKTWNIETTSEIKNIERYHTEIV